MAVLCALRSGSRLRVENKAGLTGQTVPGRRIPGHWPYPGPEELAEAEPVSPDQRRFLYFTPHERVLAAS